MATTQSSSLNLEQTVTVTAGQSVSVRIPNRADKTAVAAVPGGGGTVTVETTNHSPADVAADTANIYAATSIAAATGPAQVQLDNPITALRLTAATADGVFFISQ